MKLREYKNVHCIGIGGIGLSALARYCCSQGAHVTGSDAGSSRVTHDLQKEGITVYLRHNITHLSPETDLVIYSIAVEDTNPKLHTAQSKGLPLYDLSRSPWVASTQEYKTIAVCGTHGKTTTTAMVASMLQSCHLSNSSSWQFVV